VHLISLAFKYGYSLCPVLGVAERFRKEIEERERGRERDGKKMELRTYYHDYGVADCRRKASVCMKSYFSCFFVFQR
jgi:hypothetical protein